MRILIISDVPWRDDNSVGNTYSNIFKNMDNVEFANIYCKPGEPDNKIAKKYFQITEKKILSTLSVNRKNIDISSPKQITVLNGKEQKVYDLARILRFQSFFLARELIWKIGKWKSKELTDFLKSFNPDIIFSFCLDSFYYSNLIDYCKSYTKAELVLFFADDIYAYININPLYLVYKYFVRKKILKMGDLSDLIYGASQELCEEYSVLFRKKIHPLYKICEDSPQKKSKVVMPLKITYAGNLFYGRWKTLSLVAKAIKEINENSYCIQLDIYTTGLITKQMQKALNICGSSTVKGSVPYDDIKEILKCSDLVLHVESFEKKEIRKTRLSFSTKIVDCMQSGICLLAVGPGNLASIKYLSDNNIALVVSSNNGDEIKQCLEEILKNNDIITNTALSMKQFATDKHSISSIQKNLYIRLERQYKICEENV